MRKLAEDYMVYEKKCGIFVRYEPRLECPKLRLQVVGRMRAYPGSKTVSFQRGHSDKSERLAIRGELSFAIIDAVRFRSQS